MRGRLVYAHRDPEDLARALWVRVAGDSVRVVCGAPGLVTVGHVLAWQEWDELVAAVDSRWPE